MITIEDLSYIISLKNQYDCKDDNWVAELIDTYSDHFITLDAIMKSDNKESFMKAFFPDRMCRVLVTLLDNECTCRVKDDTAIVSDNVFDLSTITSTSIEDQMTHKVYRKYLLYPYVILTSSTDNSCFVINTTKCKEVHDLIFPSEHYSVTFDDDEVIPNSAAWVMIVNRNTVDVDDTYGLLATEDAIKLIPNICEKYQHDPYAKLVIQNDTITFEYEGLAYVTDVYELSSSIKSPMIGNLIFQTCWFGNDLWFFINSLFMFALHVEDTVRLFSAISNHSTKPKKIKSPVDSVLHPVKAIGLTFFPGHMYAQSLVSKRRVYTCIDNKVISHGVVIGEIGGLNE